ncbi:acyl-CoA dehydrogenase family protein [Actinomycetospora sp. TBRC 11914]|uniref:acyl-CoA dehydrogenase family protein n=1 Tax=Actinomycetospora sp. TBRC 11914 TaxID=2729387 RepID=UPI00289AC375|nr:acyl-CoA dehydrogenase family protein [Actinomycetospora sp. TBRC 11914]
MELTTERRELIAALRDFCRREVGTREQRLALTDGGRESHSPELYAKLAEAGYVGIAIPEEYGGAGGDVVDQCLFFEELFAGLAPVHGAGTSHTVAGVYKRFGSEDQKKDVLSAISGGSVMSISISEPQAGSDAANISCRAERTGTGWRVNGQKTWCSDAQFAERILLVARTERVEGKPHAGLTMFDVPADVAGLAIHPIETMGGREVNDLFFTDVELDEGAVVGEPGRAWGQVMAGLNGERIVAAAQGLGMARRTFDDLLAYVTEREQFGTAIGRFQAVRHRIADLAIEIESARALTYDVVTRIVAGSTDPQVLVRLTSMAKVKVTETAKRTALEAVQLMGGYGYATEYGMEHQLRLAISPTIYAGTNEIQREIISSTYGLR